MSKKKQPKFAENLTFPHLFQPDLQDVLDGKFPLRGKWARDFFGNDRPIVLELGCGKGEYTTGLAEKDPTKNYIGVDIKGARLWRGSKTVKEKNLKNVAFIRTKIEFIEGFFGPGEIAEIWLTFSDPQPQKPRKRLTAKPFIDRYRQFLAPEGQIHLKTDSRLLFNYTQEQIDEHGYERIGEYTYNLYSEMDRFTAPMREILSIKTFYESMWLEKGFPINYLSFRAKP
ncbi:MAG TPA: tRNA (guanosine(46)-N7)-methyltransferase TrmB [Luteibaculaceae bacterium]|nr:tRNA (guanosine(46)-N7)-methyltransferase TrmB [Luteibaculaceae bacterium]